MLRTLRDRSALAIERQDRSRRKRGQTSRSPLAVEKLNLKPVGWQEFHDRAYVADLNVRTFWRL